MCASNQALNLDRQVVKRGEQVVTFTRVWNASFLRGTYVVKEHFQALGFRKILRDGLVCFSASFTGYFLL
jgi:hypothetical protein